MRTDSFSLRARIGNILQRPAVYPAWQAAFAGQKFAPVLDRNDLRHARRVLDVACGPATHTAHLADCDYGGIDINENYIAEARRKYGHDFIAADAPARSSPQGHLRLHPDKQFSSPSRQPGCVRYSFSFGLEAVSQWLYPHSPAGFAGESLPCPPSGPLRSRRFRPPLVGMATLLFEIFTSVLFEPYRISAGVALWNMVYFKGKSKR
jgi:SAM-dependent methyltransferase